MICVHFSMKPHVPATQIPIEILSCTLPLSKPFFRSYLWHRCWLPSSSEVLVPRLFFLGGLKQLHCWFVAFFCRQVQSRLSILICGIDVGSFLDQKTKCLRTVGIIFTFAYRVKDRSFPPLGLICNLGVSRSNFINGMSRFCVATAIAE